jgi:hypothetical protein
MTRPGPIVPPTGRRTRLGEGAWTDRLGRWFLSGTRRDSDRTAVTADSPGAAQCRFEGRGGLPRRLWWALLWHIKYSSVARFNFDDTSEVALAALWLEIMILDFGCTNHYDEPDSDLTPSRRRA